MCILAKVIQVFYRICSAIKSLTPFFKALKSLHNVTLKPLQNVTFKPLNNVTLLKCKISFSVTINALLLKKKGK